MSAYINVFRNYANFSGFLKKKPYWTAVLIDALIKLALFLPGILGKAGILPSLPKFYVVWVLPLGVFYSLLAWIPFWAAAVRRLHTLPKSGWTLCLGFIPVVGWILLLVFLCQEGQYEKVEGKLAILMPGFRRTMDQPRNGGWFFAALAVLIVLGWAGNREVRKHGDWELLNRYLSAGPAEIPALTSQPTPTETPMPESDVNPARTVKFTKTAGGAFLNTGDGTEVLPVGEEGLYVSRTAVSVGQYQQCVDAGVCTEAADYAAYFKDADRYPIIGVTAEQAEVYCGWAGMRLPTAAEWLQAAEGSVPGENVADGAYERNETDARRARKTGIGTIPVDTEEASVSSAGMLQMLGNTWEWTVQEDSGGFWQKLNQNKNTPVRQAFGGAWNSVTISLNQPLEALPTYAADNIGFRCVMDGAQ